MSVLSYTLAVYFSEIRYGEMLKILITTPANKAFEIRFNLHQDNRIDEKHFATLHP